MSTDELTEHQTSPRRRWQHDVSRLPQDPSDEELARDWTLSTADKAEICLCRGDDNRLRFALQLCTLRLHGCFLNDYAAVPLRIVNHLARQLALPPVLLLDPSPRPATESDYQQRLRHYLGYRLFGPDVQGDLEQRLTQQASDGVSAEQLLEHTKDLLRLWRVIPPALSTLERLVASVAVHAQDALFERITDRLSPETRCIIDTLLVVPQGEHRSLLFYLKAYPPESTPSAILTYLERDRLLRSLGVGAIDLSGLSSDLVSRLARLVRYYDAEDLKRFPMAKRSALVACFLMETHKTILDHLVEMHSQFLTGMSRRARHALDKRRREIRRRAKKSLDTVLYALEILLDPTRPRETMLTALYREVDEPILREALTNCRTFQRLEERGFVDALCARHSHLKRYLPAFLELPFAAEPGMQHLLAALELSRRLNTGEMKVLPADAPIQFVPSSWRGALVDDDGQLDRRVWELALAFTLRDALRAGDLYLAESRHHVSFWNLVYDETRWIEERQKAYLELHLPSDVKRALHRLREEFHHVVATTNRGLPQNPFATIQDERLKLKRRDALEVPDRGARPPTGDRDPSASRADRRAPLGDRRAMSLYQGPSAPE